MGIVTPHLEPSDTVLAQRCAAGDLAALQRIYDRWHRQIFGLLRHMLGDYGYAEDVLQEVFYDFWRNAPRYEPARLSLSAWLFRIARNRAIDQLRRQATRARTAAALGALPPPPPPDAEEAAWLRERNRQLHDALAGLPAEERRVLTVLYFGGLTQMQAASALGIPLGTVKTRCRRGLQRLAETLQGINADEARVRA